MHGDLINKALAEQQAKNRREMVRDSDQVSIVEPMSPSRLWTWETCHERFFHQYVIGTRTPKSAAQAFGTAFDDTANKVYAEKLHTGTTTKRHDVSELFREQWRASAEVVEVWEDDKPDELTDIGTVMAGQWRDQIAVELQPVEVQTKAMFVHPDVTIRGYADVVADRRTGGRIIGDQKTAKKRWNKTTVDRNVQSVAYALGKGIDDFEFHVGVKTANPSIQLIQTRVSPRDKAGLILRASIAKRDILHALRTGDFAPNRNHYLCTKRHCAFWRECIKRHGGRVAD